MRFGAIVVCRMDSQRLPGKVLKDVQEKPLLWYIIARCRFVEEFAENIIIATSDRVIDDPLEQFGHMQNVAFYRGTAQNVAGRVLACARMHHLDWFARVNADSPFLDPALLSKACRVAESGTYDLVTNLLPRTFPYGVSVELIRTETYAKAYLRMNDCGVLEHVTKFLYDHIDDYSYFNIRRRGKDLSYLRMTVDLEEELSAFRDVVNQVGLDASRISYLDAVNYYTQIQRAA